MAIVPPSDVQARLPGRVLADLDWLGVQVHEGPLRGGPERRAQGTPRAEGFGLGARSRGAATLERRSIPPWTRPSRRPGLPGRGRASDCGRRRRVGVGWCRRPRAQRVEVARAPAGAARDPCARGSPAAASAGTQRERPQGPTAAKRGGAVVPSTRRPAPLRPRPPHGRPSDVFRAGSERRGVSCEAARGRRGAEGRARNFRLATRVERSVERLSVSFTGVVRGRRVKRRGDPSRDPAVPPAAPQGPRPGLERLLRRGRRRSPPVSRGP